MNNGQNSLTGLSRRNIIKYPLYAGLLAPLSASLWITGCRKQPHPNAHNIVLITVDTLRADALGCYGNQNAKTPFIDSLASKGILFENVMCQAPATGPSFASMMTSKYPTACGVLHNTMVLKKSQKTLAEVLQKNGYNTAGFVSCTILKSEYGFSQGFDVFDENMEKHYSKNDLERSAAAATRAVLSWLRARPSQPFFLWVHYFDSHAPYQSHTDISIPEQIGSINFLQQLGSEQSRSKLQKYLPEIKKLYAGEVNFVDRHVGKILAQLDKSNITDNTVIAFAADHGEELFDHSFFHGHVKSLYQSVLHTPLILSFPPELPRAIRVSALVENLDIFPTLLALAHIARPKGISGINLLKVLNSQSILADRCTYSQREPVEGMPGGNAFAIRHKNFKYIAFSKAPDEFYNLESDPAESVILTSGFEKQREFLQKKLAQLRANDFSAPRTIKRQNLNSREIERLKSLGYIE